MDLKFGIKDPKFDVMDLKFGVRDPKFNVCNVKFDLFYIKPLIQKNKILT